MGFDVIIKNGTVVDGTGKPSRKASIGISGAYITAIGDLNEVDAAHIIDANEKVVCPGFIDVHVHSELALLGGSDRYAPLQMGVTTQLVGPDGFSWAPLSSTQLKQTIDYYRTFYDQSILEQFEGLSMEQLLDLWSKHIPSNIALQVPHAAVRLAVIGWDPRPAKPEELKQMDVLVRKWLEAGAKAFATGLEYEPMRHADLRELEHFSRITAEYGGIYVAHQRGYGDNVKTGCDETFAIARNTGIPVHISHFTVDDAAEAMVESAIRAGIDVTFDMYPYPAGCTSLLFSLPQQIQAGSIDEVSKRLRDPKVRNQMREYLESSVPAKRVTFASVGFPNSGLEGKTLAEVQEEFGENLTDTICDILLESKFQTLMIYHWPEERHRFLEKTFKHEKHMVATDGVYVGKMPHPRGFGTYPKVLKKFVYENHWLSLEQAVYKMSGFQAERFKLSKRGKLQIGNYADVVIFDPKVIDDGPTFKKARTPNCGLEHVLVNGKPVISYSAIIKGNNGMLLT